MSSQGSSRVSSASGSARSNRWTTSSLFLLGRGLESKLPPWLEGLGMTLHFIQLYAFTLNPYLPGHSGIQTIVYSCAFWGMADGRLTGQSFPEYLAVFWITSAVVLMLVAVWIGGVMYTQFVTTEVLPRGMTYVVMFTSSVGYLPLLFVFLAVTQMSSTEQLVNRGATSIFAQGSSSNPSAALTFGPQSSYAVFSPVVNGAGTSTTSLKVAVDSTLSVWMFPQQLFATNIVTAHIVVASIMAFALTVLSYLALCCSLSSDLQLKSQFARGNMIVEQLALVIKLVFALAFFLLVPRGHRSVYTATIAVGSYTMMAAHCIFLPFIHHTMQYIHVVLYALSGTFAVATFVLTRDRTGMLFLANGGYYASLAVGGVATIFVAYWLSKWRLCPITQLLLSRVTCPGFVPMMQIPFYNACVRGQPSLLPFPYRLPISDHLLSPFRTLEIDIVEEAISAEAQLGEAAGVAAGDVRGVYKEEMHEHESGSRMGSLIGSPVYSTSRGAGSSHMGVGSGGEGPEGVVARFAASLTPVFNPAGADLTVPKEWQQDSDWHRDFVSFMHYATRVQVVSPTITTAWLPSDAEVATRFLHHWTLLTGKPPTPHMLYFACRIYLKFLLLFPNSIQVNVSFVQFLSTYAPSMRRMYLCVDILERVEAIPLALLADRCVAYTVGSSVKDVLGMRDRAHQLMYRRGRSMHRETLIQTAALWKALEEKPTLAILSNLCSALTRQRDATTSLYLQTLNVARDDEALFRSFGDYCNVVLHLPNCARICLEEADMLGSRRRQKLLRGLGGVEGGVIGSDGNSFRGSSDHVTSSNNMRPPASSHQAGGSAKSTTSVALAHIYASLLDFSTRLRLNISSLGFRITAIITFVLLLSVVVVVTYVNIQGLMGSSSTINSIEVIGSLRTETEIVPSFVQRLIQLAHTIGLGRRSRTAEYQVTLETLEAAYRRFCALQAILMTKSALLGSTSSRRTLEVPAAFVRVISEPLMTMSDDAFARFAAAVTGVPYVSSSSSSGSTSAASTYSAQSYPVLPWNNLEVISQNLHEVGESYKAALEQVISVFSQIPVPERKSLISNRYVQFVLINSNAGVSSAYEKASQEIESDMHESASTTQVIILACLFGSFMVLVFVYYAFLWQFTRTARERVQSLNLFFTIPKEHLKRMAISSREVVVQFIAGDPSSPVDLRRKDLGVSVRVADDDFDLGSGDRVSGGEEGKDGGGAGNQSPSPEGGDTSEKKASESTTSGAGTRSERENSSENPTSKKDPLTHSSTQPETLGDFQRRLTNPSIKSTAFSSNLLSRLVAKKSQVIEVNRREIKEKITSSVGPHHHLLGASLMPPHSGAAVLGGGGGDRSASSFGNFASNMDEEDDGVVGLLGVSEVDVAAVGAVGVNRDPHHDNGGGDEEHSTHTVSQDEVMSVTASTASTASSSEDEDELEEMNGLEFDERSGGGMVIHSGMTIGAHLRSPTCSACVLVLLVVSITAGLALTLTQYSTDFAVMRNVKDNRAQYQDLYHFRIATEHFLLSGENFVATLAYADYREAIAALLEWKAAGATLESRAYQLHESNKFSEFFFNRDAIEKNTLAAILLAVTYTGFPYDVVPEVGGFMYRALNDTAANCRRYHPFMLDSFNGKINRSSNAWSANLPRLNYTTAPVSDDSGYGYCQDWFPYKTFADDSAKTLDEIRDVSLDTLFGLFHHADVTIFRDMMRRMLSELDAQYAIAVAEATSYKSLILIGITICFCGALVSALTFILIFRASLGRIALLICVGVTLCCCIGIVFGVQGISKGKELSDLHTRQSNEGANRLVFIESVESISRAARSFVLPSRHRRLFLQNFVELSNIGDRMRDAGLYDFPVGPIEQAHLDGIDRLKRTLNRFTFQSAVAVALMEDEAMRIGPIEHAAPRHKYLRSLKWSIENEPTYLFEVLQYTSEFHPHTMYTTDTFDRSLPTLEKIQLARNILTSRRYVDTSLGASKDLGRAAELLLLWKTSQRESVEDDWYANTKATLILSVVGFGLVALLVAIVFSTYIDEQHVSSNLRRDWDEVQREYIRPFVRRVTFVLGFIGLLLLVISVVGILFNIESVIAAEAVGRFHRRQLNLFRASNFGESAIFNELLPTRRLFDSMGAGFVVDDADADGHNAYFHGGAASKIMTTKLNEYFFGDQSYFLVNTFNGSSVSVVTEGSCVVTEERTSSSYGNQAPVEITIQRLLSLVSTIAGLPQGAIRRTPLLTSTGLNTDDLINYLFRVKGVLRRQTLHVGESFRDAALSYINLRTVLLFVLGAIAVLLLLFAYVFAVYPTWTTFIYEELGIKLVLTTIPQDVAAVAPEITDYYDVDASSKNDQLKKKLQQSEKLLQNILPPVISRRLKNGETCIADDHKSVTVVFAALMGFDEYSINMGAREIVMFLNDLIVSFDQIVDVLELEKIKTIGDVYFLCGGLTKKTESDHALRCMEAAMFFIEALDEHNIRHRTPNIALRVGVNTDPAVAGVIGHKKVAYDLWGDSVNTASRMQSTGLPGRIQISEKTYEEVRQYYGFTSRSITAKGKGELTTYLFHRRLKSTPFSHVNWRHNTE